MNEGQGGLASGGIYSTPVQEYGDIVIKNSKPKKRWKKWVIGGVVVIILLCVVALIIMLMGERVATDNMEGAKSAYWTYMNYLISGEDSDEILSKSDYAGVSVAVKKAFDDNDKNYFDKLKDSFAGFDTEFEMVSAKFGEADNDMVAELGGLVSFIVGLENVGVLNKDELVDRFMSGQILADYERDKLNNMDDGFERTREYIEDRILFAQYFEEYLMSVRAAGCLNSEGIDVVCLVLADNIDKNENMDDYLYQIERTEKLAVDLLVWKSWDTQNLFLGDEYAKE